MLCVVPCAPDHDSNPEVDANVHQKRSLIDGAEDLKNGIIFCNRKRDVADVYRSLQRHEYSCGALHGDMDQTSRTATLNAFRDNKISVLVASDVAARGLDIPDVSHVFNFDVPVNAEDYVHRIGRTGRAGREGTAYMIVTPSEQKGFDAIEELIEKKVDWLGDPVEWDEFGGKRRRGKKARPESGKAKPDKQDGQSKSSKKGGGKDHQIGAIDYSDAAHAFGGEENVPAFLLKAG